MIELKRITEDNFEDCIGLSVIAYQTNYLSSNAYSSSKAYALTNQPLNLLMFFAIYNEDAIVEFTLIVCQPIDITDPDDDEDIYYLPCIRIDQKYQGLGYGKKALHQIIELVKIRPHGLANALILASSPEIKIAYSLYVSVGFQEMGIKDIDGDELLKLTL